MIRMADDSEPCLVAYDQESGTESLCCFDEDCPSRESLRYAIEISRFGLWKISQLNGLFQQISIKRLPQLLVRQLKTSTHRPQQGKPWLSTKLPPLLTSPEWTGSTE